MNVAADSTNIVLEGPDGGGKSSLAVVVSGLTGMRIQQGSGPPRGPGEMERRLSHYLTMRGVIFDRHPAVSQPIYGQLRWESQSTEFSALVDQFYDARDTIFVYCRSTDAARHVVKPGEDPAHVEVLTRRYHDLVQAYDRWASQHAHLLFRVGDDPLDVASVISNALARRR